MADVRSPAIGTGGGGWTKTTYSAAADMPDTVPQAGVDTWYRCLLHSDQAQTTSNFVAFVNGDLTAANYHAQRALAQDGVGSFIESTTPNGTQQAGGTNVAGYFSVVYLYYPFFRMASRQRTCLLWSCIELAATSQQCSVSAVKRQGASVTGTITDPLTSVNMRHPTQVCNYSGEVHRMAA
jgi:hypothetical protein